MNKNIRDLENMPLNIKFLYSKILSAMVCADYNYNQLKLAEFYRIINKIQLSSKKRIQLMNSIITKKVDFFEISQQIDLDKHLNNQEKNIFRFSLMKDLIIIMKSDYIETDNEKKLLENIKDYFNISNEQFSFFIKEYESDRNFFKNMTDNSKDHKELKKIAKNTIATASALGIPLVVLNYSGTFKGLGTLGIISGLKAIGGKKRTGKSSITLGLVTSILLAITTYKTTKYILNIKKDDRSKLIQLTKDNIEDLHESTKNIMYKDIGYFNNRLAEIKDKNNQDLKNILKIIDILERAVATLENTEAVII